MRSTFAVATPLLLLLGSGVADAADPTQLAETGGFLLGNASRCGVAAERVESAGKVIHEFIAAAARDASEAAAADSRFSEIFLTARRTSLRLLVKLETSHSGSGSSDGREIGSGSLSSAVSS